MAKKAKTEATSVLNDLAFDGLTTWMEKCIDTASAYMNSYLSETSDSSDVETNFYELKECVDDVADGIKTVGPTLVSASINEIVYDGALIKAIRNDVGAYKLDDVARKNFKICYDRKIVGSLDINLIDALEAKLKVWLPRIVGLLHSEYSDDVAEELYELLHETMNLMYTLDHLYSEAYCLYMQIQPFSRNKDPFVCTITVGE